MNVTTKAKWFIEHLGFLYFLKTYFYLAALGLIYGTSSVGKDLVETRPPILGVTRTTRPIGHF